MFKRAGFGFLTAVFFLAVLLIAGGCEQAPEQRIAQVDLEILLEESETAGRMQQEFEDRESDFADYYQQIDIGGPETGEQYSVYQRYLQLVETRRQELDELIARAIDKLEEKEEFSAVITADTAYKVSEDITLQVAEKIDNLSEESKEAEEHRENHEGEKFNE